MNKEELVASMSEESGIPKKDCKKFLKTLLGQITKNLADGNRIRIVGFGTFTACQTPGRSYREIHTERKGYIPPCIKVRFATGKTLKDAVDT